MSSVVQGHEEVIFRLNLLPRDYFSKEKREALLSKAATPVHNAMVSRAPISKGLSANRIRRQRSRRDFDGGEVHRRGQLRRSIQVMRHKKDRYVNTVMVGPLIRKYSPVTRVKGHSLKRGKRNVAYYASIVLAKDKGSWHPFGGRNNQRVKPVMTFVKDAYNSRKQQSNAIIVREAERLIKDFKGKYGF